MSGDRVTLMGDAMASVVQRVAEVRDILGQPPVVVGGLAVLVRLSTPYRATVDLDVVDRDLGTDARVQDAFDEVAQARARACVRTAAGFPLGLSLRGRYPRAGSAGETLLIIDV